VIARRALAVLCAAALVAACTDEPDDEAFCAAAERTVAAGPLFPDRTDGEPVAEPDALAALEDLAEASPDAIAGEVEVLLAEARALVADAEARQDPGESTTSTTVTGSEASERPTRSEVDAAQSAVVAYASDTCAIDLNA
jgi:hypothetical protein